VDKSSIKANDVFESSSRVTIASKLLWGSAMSTAPRLTVRLLDDLSGYVIDANWLDAPPEQLGGVFVSREFAERWISENGKIWIEALMREKP
jgi:hypothetical protein